MKNPAKKIRISAHQKHCSKFRKMLSIALCLTMRSQRRNYTSDYD